MFNFKRTQPSATKQTVILTKFLSNDYYFERKDHAPNFKFDGKRYATEEAALASVGNNILTGDTVEFIDAKEKCIKTYIKGSNKCTINKNGQSAIVTVNF